MSKRRPLSLEEVVHLSHLAPVEAQKLIDTYGPLRLKKNHPGYTIVRGPRLRTRGREWKWSPFRDIGKFPARRPNKAYWNRRDAEIARRRAYDAVFDGI